MSAPQHITDGIYVVRGLVNIYIVETTDGCAVIDTGFPGSTSKILRAVTAIGRKPEDVRHILVSHAHPDHMGSAGSLKRETGAAVYAHPIDAPIIEAGTGYRDAKACPGIRNKIVAAFLRRLLPNAEPMHVDHLLQEGDSLPFAPDLSVIHVPGHSAGQISFHFKRGGGVLIPADSCVNLGRMKLPATAEDLAQARDSLRKLAAYDFEALGFMHGPPVLAGADKKFRAWVATNP
jgi:glyoxylase-like metal-dependent hydrolase (beta-lactamase superfamily II)